MIGLAWSISFILWAPAILFWQYLVGERTVQPNQCYIQFLSEPIITFCTAIAAFYLPVTIMSVLFWKIYQETENRAKDLAGLRWSGSGKSQPRADGSTGATGSTGNSGQNESSATLTQINNLHNYSGDEPSQATAVRHRKHTVESHRRRFNFWLSLMLPICHSSKRSSTTTTVGEFIGETEGSSSEGCNNNDNITDSEEEEVKGKTEAIYSIVADVFLQGSGDDENQGRTEEGTSRPSKGWTL